MYHRKARAHNEKELLGILKKYGEWGIDGSVSHLAYDAHISVHAAYQRLNRLHKLGYVDRYRYHGKTAWMYKIKDDKNTNIL
ncbi:hypothetical protein NVIE_012000 [Nitrososphaera viennensis EN76]|uniref:Uncharacterized protein n=1 Tax=Nitrososphaera viennensis EN76 TaxID=926571 RepID=A0A060HFR2_9ARCH|nr:hypothetical protein NVIE_012000 [Nitrososphaera viennensis EN76]